MAKDELQKHTLNLYRGDYARIRDLYPEGDAASIIRDVVRAFIQKVEAAGRTPDIGEIDGP